MPRRRSSMRRSIETLFDGEPKTPRGTPAYGAAEHNAWLAHAYGWGREGQRAASPGQIHTVVIPTEDGPVTIYPRTPSAKLAAEPAWVEERRRHGTEAEARRRTDVDQTMALEDSD